MTFACKSLFVLHRLLLASVLTTAGASVMAQIPTNAQGDAGTTAPAAGPRGERMGRHDPAKMQAYVAKRQAEMKAKLKITSAQEAAWATYTASMQPPVRMGERPTTEQRAEFDKLTTPQRIDKMREMRTQRMAQMAAATDKHGEATKTFYAVLSPEQQKLFDAEHKMRGGRHGGGHHGGMGMEHGRG